MASKDNMKVELRGVETTSGESNNVLENCGSLPKEVLPTRDALEF